MNNLEKVTLVDLFLRMDAETEQARVGIIKAQDELANDLLTYAIQQPIEQFRDNLNGELDNSDTRRLIDAKMGSIALSRIVGSTDMYPTCQENLKLLIEAIYPDIGYRVDTMLQDSGGLSHVSGEVRGFVWSLVEEGLENYHNMDPPNRKKISANILSHLYQNIDKGREDDTTRCLKLISRLLNNNLTVKLNDTLSQKLGDIISTLRRGNEAYLLRNQLLCIQMSILSFMVDNPDPGETLIHCAIMIFELELPHETIIQRENQNVLKSIGAAILDKLDSEDLSVRVEHWVSQSDVSKKIDLFGCLFYVDHGQHHDRCAIEFKNLIKDMSNDRDVKFWASRSKGKKAQGPLGIIGVDENSLDQLFNDPDHVNIVREIWAMPPRRGDFGDDSTYIPVTLKVE